MSISKLLSKSKSKLIKQKGGNLTGSDISNSSPSAYNQDFMNQVYPNNVGLQDNIYVDTQTSFGWHNQNDVNKMYSVDINAGYNDYMFSRTTPDNKFITTTGLELHKGINSFELVGGKKKVSSKKKEPKKKPKKEDLKKKLLNSFSTVYEKIKKSGKKLTNYIKSETFIKKDTSTKSKPKSKPKTSPKKESSSKSKPKTSPKKESSSKSKSSKKASDSKSKTSSKK